MQRSLPSTMSDHMQAGIIPVWAGSLGSWNFSIGRRAFAARELEGHYDDASDRWHATISKLGFEAAYAGLVEQALPEVATLGCAGPLKVLDAGCLGRDVETCPAALERSRHHRGPASGGCEQPAVCRRLF